MRKFEYISVETKKGTVALDELNKLGKEGWKLVVVNHARNKEIWILTREKDKE